MMKLEMRLEVAIGAQTTPGPKMNSKRVMQMYVKVKKYFPWAAPARSVRTSVKQ